VHLARQAGGFKVGWVLPEYDEHARLKFEAVKPDFLFCDHEKLPAGGAKALARAVGAGRSMRSKRRKLALALAERGADFVDQWR